FCGSGTIPIEAALIAKNRAPGLDRSFDAQKWGFVPDDAWLDAADEAMDKEFHGTYDIWGGDVNPQAVAIAKDNARKAGVDDIVRFEVADMQSFHRDSEYGQLVTNPPYGERLLEKQEAEELYRQFGKVWRDLPPKWRTLVLSSHTEFERTFGKTADKKRKLYNGMIKCDVFMYGNV
ncbi:MAG: methyltransferase, partial [Eubacteriales bacterium]|nr:methyltransferase [Eubacteriales bacterium]